MVSLGGMYGIYVGTLGGNDSDRFSLIPFLNIYPTDPESDPRA
jgi:hypothetical protein